jgi:nuclear receptor subfamily 5 group A protein 2
MGLAPPTPHHHSMSDIHGLPPPPPLPAPPHVPAPPTTNGAAPQQNTTQQQQQQPANYSASNHSSAQQPPPAINHSSGSSSSSSHPSAAAAAVPTSPAGCGPPPQTPPLIRDLQKNEPEQLDVQRKLSSTADMMLSQQRDSQQERLAEGTELSKADIALLCKLCDQALFLLVEWARSAHFFKDLKVEDQMKLLQNCWSELLILDFIFKQMEHSSEDQLLLITGHRVSVDMISKIGLGECKDRLLELIKKFRDLKLDRNEYSCLRFLVLLNPDVGTLSNRGAVEACQEKVNSTLLEYCSRYYAPLRDKFGQLLVRLPEIRLISISAENYLYVRHLKGDIPESTLLMEMLHSKRK